MLNGLYKMPRNREALTFIASASLDGGGIPGTFYFNICVTMLKDMHSKNHQQKSGARAQNRVCPRN
jgi:hypothetical protein